MPVFRFKRAFNITRNIRVDLSLSGGLVRDEYAPKPPANRDVKPRNSRQHTLSPAGQLEERKLDLSRVKEEIAGAKTIPERQASKKKLIETQHEIFRLRDELNASEDRANGVAKDPALPSAAGQQRVGPLPDFVVIGAQKCGTSTFYNLLTLHKHVQRAALKELHYFDDRFDEGIEWYRRCFPSPLWKDGRRTITGEATPSYISDSNVPERMAKYVPDAKLILLLRNPVDRAYSHYHHMERLNAENQDFESAIQRELERLKGGVYGESRDYRPGSALRFRAFAYLSRGIYADQLSRWLKFFDRGQIFVAKSEDFYRDTPSTLKNVTEFLGLPEWEVPVREPSNAGKYPPMNPDTRRWLSEYFEPHNQRLYELLNEDFGW